MNLSFSFLVLLSLCAFAIGDDFASCTSGSSCTAWKDLIDGPVEIDIQDGTKADDVQYYRIDVTYGKSRATFSKLRRYSEFVDLRKRLGLDDAAEDVFKDTAPFPPKLVLNSIVQAMWPETLNERRVQLDVWLQAVLEHENSKVTWADALFDFLDPKESVSAALSGIRMPPDANKMCKALTWPVTSDKHYFGIDFDNGSDKPVRVWRRYSDFAALNETLGTQDFDAIFPEKLYWNSVIPMWEKKLEQRRRGLEAWLRQVKLHENSAEGGIWAEELKKFLDPEDTEKLQIDCDLNSRIDATMAELTKVYAQAKDKFDELTKEQIVEEPTESTQETQEL